MNSYQVDYHVQRLIQDSPYPVHFVEDADFAGSCKNSKSLILINNALYGFELLGCLVHELKHASCFLNGCACYTYGDSVDREFCAFTEQLQYALDLYEDDFIKDQIKEMRYYDKRGSYAYYASSRRVMETDLFKKCCEIVEPKKTLLRRVWEMAI